MRPPGIEIGPSFSADEYNPYKRDIYKLCIRNSIHISPSRQYMRVTPRLGKCALEASERQHAAVHNKAV